jgi:apolipoprotein N-acyltransferase
MSNILGRRPVRGLLYFLSGLLAALPVSFTQLSFLAFFSFVPALLLLFSDLLAPALPHRARTYYTYGMAFCMGYFMMTFHWFISLYPLDFVGGMTPFLAILVIISACVGLPLLQSLGFAFLFCLLALISRTRPVRRFPLLLPLLFACGWVTLAYTQTLTWAGVPWGAQLALSQHQNLLVVSSASFFGSYFVTFVIAAVNALMACAVLAARGKQPRTERIMALTALGFFLCNLGLGMLAHFLPQETSGTARVAVLQGNIGSADKWSGQIDALSVYRQLALDAAAEEAEIMVWPETALPYNLKGDGYSLARIKEIAKDTGAIQIVGAFYYEEGQRYNALYLFTPDGNMSETLYRKQHLVPFGEYVPMEAVIRTLLPFLANLDMLQDGSTMVPGKGPALFETAHGSLGGLICFDTIYESLARKSVAAGAELLVIGTNDSWFFDSAAVYQHNGQAVLRAIENGRAVARAANTGISSVISAKGEILDLLPPLVDGQVTEAVTLSAQKTLYTVIGDVFALLAAIAFHAPLVLSFIDYIQKKRKNAAG